MKSTLLFLIAFLTLSLGLQAQSVFNDTIMWKKADFIGATGKFLDRKQGAIFVHISAAKLVKMTPTQAARMQVPEATKSGKGPIVLKFGDNCYQFGCAKDNGCDNCRMFWWDRNEDGKVQPRRELRCFCPEGRTRCKIRVRKVNCD